MKINKIVSLCKTHHTLILFDDNERQMQWISDGHAIYPLIDTAFFGNESSICNTLGISDSQSDKINFKLHEQLPKMFDYSDSTNFENEVRTHPISIKYGTHSVIPLMTSQGTVFIEKEYFAPFGDYKDSELIYCERVNSAGQMYIAVKNGFLLIGLILPANIIDGQFLDELKELKNMCDVAWFNIRSNEKDKSEQMEMTDGEEDNANV